MAEPHQGSSGAPVATGRYRRREPESTVLHQVVREQLETFLVTVDEPGGRRPPHELQKPRP